MAMVSTSNDGIMTEYLIKYGVIKAGERNRPTELLETLYITDRYRAGDDLKKAKAGYDISIWRGVGASEVEQRLTELDDFMKTLARDRAALWGVLDRE
jgi:hypothetical protein